MENDQNFLPDDDLNFHSLVVYYKIHME